MSRLDQTLLVASPGHAAAIPSRRALLSVVGTLAVLVLGLTLASPGRADRQLIERGTELMTRAAYLGNDDRQMRDRVLTAGLRPAD
jgi:hypothetical protein